MSADRKVFVCMVAYTEYNSDARVRREAETLAANGFDVRCLSLATRSARDGAPFGLDGVEVQELPVPKYRGKNTLAYIASYLHFLLRASAACLRLLARRELDVVHVHNIPDFLVLAGLFPRLAGSKVVLDVHDSMPETFATKFAGASILHKVSCVEEKLSALVAHRVICVNHPQRDRLVSRGIAPSKTFVSMNVPDPRIFRRPAASPLRTAPSEQCNLVYHGTMAKRLGVDLVIRASAHLHQRVPHARLHLWGHGDDLAEFQRLAHDLHLNGRVLFQPAGFPLHELPERLSQMHIGVVGNRRTAAGDLMLPVKMLEYMGLDIPVVAPRLKAIEHYFRDDMVTYYEPDDVESMANAIHRLYRDPDARTRQAASAHGFLDEYGWHRQGTDLVRFYQAFVEN